MRRREFPCSCGQHRGGGNVSGLSLMGLDLSGKRLALLKEAVPGVSRVTLMIDPKDLAAKRVISSSLAAAKELMVPFGALLSYGPDFPDYFRRAVGHVDKILKGAKPADLPVEQPSRFKLTINLKAVKVIGISMPPSPLTSADEMTAANFAVTQKTSLDSETW